jgi:hypothetical protein
LRNLGSAFYVRRLVRVGGIGSDPVAKDEIGRLSAR